MGTITAKDARMTFDETFPAWVARLDEMANRAIMEGRRPAYARLGPDVRLAFEVHKQAFPLLHAPNLTGEPCFPTIIGIPWRPMPEPGLALVHYRD